MKHVFVTGATGFIGVNLVRTLLETSDAVLYLLLRETEEQAAEERMKSLLNSFCTKERDQEYLRRVRAIKGDLCKENLGVSSDIWNELSEKIDTIFHSAATIHFNLPYEEASEINLGGTRRILALASNCHENKVLIRFNHISTAYVSGKTKMFCETDFDIGQQFANTYEQTKLETELEVLEHYKKGLPVMIFRPSLVTGNSKTGEIGRSSLLYIFIQYILDGSFKDFICNDDTTLNFVHVDYVVEAMLQIPKSDANLGKAFNLTNKRNENVKQMIITVCRHLDVEPPRFFSIEEKDKASKLMRMALAPFVDYMNICHTFDNTLTKEALEGSEVVCPEVSESTIARIFAYIFNEMESP